MHKLLLLFCAFFFVTSISAQSTFSWGLSLFPNFSNRRLINTGGRLSEKAIFELDELEKAHLSYAAGLEAEWRSEKLGFNLGLRYMNTGYRVGRTLLPPDDPNAGIAAESELSFRQNNVELPIEVLFIQDLSDKTAFFFMLGTALNYNLNSNLELTLYNNSSSETISTDPDYEWRKFNYAFQTGMGWKRKLNTKLELTLQPTFQFWMKGIYEDRAEINRNLYNLGVRIGFRFLSETKE